MSTCNRFFDPFSTWLMIAAATNTLSQVCPCGEYDQAVWCVFLDSRCASCQEHRNLRSDRMQSFSFSWIHFNAALTFSVLILAFLLVMSTIVHCEFSSSLHTEFKSLSSSTSDARSGGWFKSRQMWFQNYAVAIKNAPLLQSLKILATMINTNDALHLTVFQ